jgi:endonuclease G
MAPNGDMPDAQSQYESFALSNVVPQDADDNRHLWADIKSAVRELVLAGDDTVKVVTGPTFEPDTSWLRDGVAVPSLLFKPIYDPDAGIAGVYVAHNVPEQSFEALSLSAFTRRFGIAPFPALIDNPVASSIANLPTPRSRRPAPLSCQRRARLGFVELMEVDRSFEAMKEKS